jgi:hypothetical protein
MSAFVLGERWYRAQAQRGEDSDEMFPVHSSPVVQPEILSLWKRKLALYCLRTPAPRQVGQMPEPLQFWQTGSGEFSWVFTPLP